MTDDKPSQSYLSCAAVARRLGLSRQRFWQLRKEGVFPGPQIDEDTGRPFYTEEQLELCMDLRNRNVGINGKIVLFYSARSTASLPAAPRKKKSKRREAKSRHQELIDSLKVIGMTGVTDAQIDSAISELFPNGKDSVNPGELVRAVFLYIQRKNSSA
ncbi:helix-turn-helix transcriptional regulator [Bremerella alba]|uniref:Uncharacterized protein n=1 Tax=Bremerella alba TaxID=980252 RepID=A0A7V9A8S0_9BACT|nr:hypothetical protein [Bremerella alba]MBA2116702.1 hypothetical protein [Bremerella alba]